MTRVACAIYTRKSSDEGLDKEFNSLDAQREACEAYILSQKHAGWFAVRDLYESRTVERLAKRARPENAKPEEQRTPRRTGHPLLATFVQSLWLLLGLVIAGPVAYYAAYHGIPELTSELGQGTSATLHFLVSR